jgi:hypothetical protein
VIVDDEQKKSKKQLKLLKNTSMEIDKQMKQNEKKRRELCYIPIASLGLAFNIKAKLRFNNN